MLGSSQVTTASDPKLVKATSHFDYTEGTYRVDTAMDHLAVHFDMEGWYLIYFVHRSYSSLIYSPSYNALLV